MYAGFKYSTYAGVSIGVEDMIIPVDGKDPSNDKKKIIEKAVWGMLPKNRLGRATLKKLHIFSDAEHVHESQNPEKINLDIQKVRR